MEHPDDDLQRDEKKNTIDDSEGGLFDDSSDENLNKLLKEFGASHDDVKEVKVDLDLTKPWLILYLEIISTDVINHLICYVYIQDIVYVIHLTFTILFIVETFWFILYPNIILWY